MSEFLNTLKTLIGLGGGDEMDGLELADVLEKYSVFKSQVRILFLILLGLVIVLLIIIIAQAVSLRHADNPIFDDFDYDGEEEEEEEEEEEPKKARKQKKEKKKKEDVDDSRKDEEEDDEDDDITFINLDD